jgi:hypothetical protein
MGYFAGNTIVAGSSYNTFLGTNADVNGPITVSYSSAIGYNTKIDASNQIVLGGDNGSGVYPTVKVSSLNSVGLVHTDAAGVLSTGLVLTADISSNIDLSGVPTAPTAAVGTSTGQLATTAFVSAAKANFVQTATSDPTATTGAMYFNTSDSKLYVYTGSAWKSVLLA